MTEEEKAREVIALVRDSAHVVPYPELAASIDVLVRDDMTFVAEVEPGTRLMTIGTVVYVCQPGKPLQYIGDDGGLVDVGSPDATGKPATPPQVP